MDVNSDVYKYVKGFNYSKFSTISKQALIDKVIESVDRYIPIFKSCTNDEYQSKMKTIKLALTLYMLQFMAGEKFDLIKISDLTNERVSEMLFNMDNDVLDPTELYKIRDDKFKTILYLTARNIVSQLSIDLYNDEYFGKFVNGHNTTRRIINKLHKDLLPFLDYSTELIKYGRNALSNTPSNQRNYKLLAL